MMTYPEERGFGALLFQSNKLKSVIGVLLLVVQRGLFVGSQEIHSYNTKKRQKCFYFIQQKLEMSLPINM